MRPCIVAMAVALLILVHAAGVHYAGACIRAVAVCPVADKRVNAFGGARRAGGIIHSDRAGTWGNFRLEAGTAPLRVIVGSTA